MTSSLNSVPPGYYRAEGTIKNFNTVEEYKNADKMQILQQAGRTVRAPR
jgi:ubiquitin-like modifier-activating enzyme ATG7